MELLYKPFGLRRFRTNLSETLYISELSFRYINIDCSLGLKKAETTIDVLKEKILFWK